MSRELAGRHRVFDEWAATVRDPARQRSEGPRRLRAKTGRAVLECESAPLRDGRWAVRYSFDSAMSGMSSPWYAYPSREACIAELLKQARWFFPSGSVQSEGSADEGRRETLRLLGEEPLFGFVEPASGEEPEPLAENPDDK